MRRLLRVAVRGEDDSHLVCYRLWAWINAQEEDWPYNLVKAFSAF